MRLVVAPLLALAVVVAAAACSSDADDAAPTTTTTTTAPEQPGVADTVSDLEEFDVPDGSHPHDVAVAADGTVWYTAQRTGKLGRFTLSTGKVEEVPLGRGSSPHGVIVGPDGAPWVTDTGLNAIVRVDPQTKAVRRFEPPAGTGRVGMHTAAFDQSGVLWFTGNAGYYGRLYPNTARMEVFEAPEGSGPYGIAVAPDGGVWYASLGQSHLAKVDPATGKATVLLPPTPDQGARRVWADSKGRIWTSQWNAGQVAVYDPATSAWKEWRLPGDNPQAYSVYVDDQDMVWLTDFGANAIVRFDPGTEQFKSYPLPSKPGAVRQMLGRPGEVWGAESAADKLIVIRTRTRPSDT